MTFEQGEIQRFEVFFTNAWLDTVYDSNGRF